jgi:hypothetical protein
MQTFELQIYRNGNWKTDSMYDDRALAEMEARRMDESGRYESLRVIEEVFDRTTEKTKVRTIYRDKNFQDKATRKTKSVPKRTVGKPKTASRKGNFKGRRRPEAKPSANISKIVITLGLIGLIGVAGLVALKYLLQVN